MRIIIVAILAVALLYYLIWDTVVRKNSLNWLMIPLVSLLFLPLGLMELRWSVMESKMSAVVDDISGRKGGKVHCQRLSEAFFDTKVSAAGHVSSDNPNTAVVNYEQCQHVFAWLERGKGQPSREQAHAIHVLTHEAVHVSGEYNEAITECTAINRDHMTVELLGGSKETGQKLASFYHSTIWPQMSKEYILQGCAIDPQFDSILIIQEEAKKAASK
jgi:hypothetical protein